MDLFIKIGRIILLVVFAVGSVVKIIMGFIDGHFINAILDGVIFGSFMSLIMGTLLVFIWIFVNLVDKSRRAKKELV
jgi:hypothetical protein